MVIGIVILLFFCGNGMYCVRFSVLLVFFGNEKLDSVVYCGFLLFWKVLIVVLRVVLSVVLLCYIFFISLDLLVSGNFM